VKFFNLVFILPVVVALGVLAGPAITQSTVSAEYNTNRPGSDYLQFERSGDDPTPCSNACAADLRCRAFTYVVRGVQGPNARCWLKSAVPAAASHNCCVSGVKTAAQPTEGFVGWYKGMDLYEAGDYRSVALAAPDPNACLVECGRDARCRSVSYTGPGAYGLPRAVCWLKAGPGRLGPNVLAMSAIKGASNPPPPPPPPPPPSQGLTGDWGAYTIVHSADNTFTWTLGSPPHELGRGAFIGPDRVRATWGAYPSGTGYGPLEGKVLSQGGVMYGIDWENGVRFRRPGY
jgi:hypothetical protein